MDRKKIEETCIHNNYEISDGISLHVSFHLLFTHLVSCCPGSLFDLGFVFVII